jgi:T-complex protein 1 subunit zeta
LVFKEVEYQFKSLLFSMSSVQFINPKAEVLKKIQALAMNVNAAMGLQDIMKTNLGPKGTLKMF